MASHHTPLTGPLSVLRLLWLPVRLRHAAASLSLLATLAAGPAAAAPVGTMAPALAASADLPQVSLTPDQAAQDVRVLRQAMNTLHPALTKYRSRAEIDTALATFEQRGKAARSAGEMYLAATELAAAIRCGHTWTNVLNQSGAAKARLLGRADKLPLQLSLVEGRWLVLASADPAVAAGDELLAVDGVPAQAMVARLLPYLRADGNSDNKRLRQLDHGRGDYSQMDILWPLLQPPDAQGYALQLRRAAGGPVQTLRLAATTLAARGDALKAQGQQPRSTAWALQIDGPVATLSLPTWSFWNSRFDWAGFLQASFDQLQAQQVPVLVIDIRANEGGDGAIGERLLSYLIQQPLTVVRQQNVSAYERVPYALARHLDTWDFGFFDRTGDVERITQGTAAGLWRVRSRAAAPRVISPVARPYAGRTFVLVGGENSSATFMFADLVQRSAAATLVGQATGGNQRGLNGGQIAWVNLPNSGVAVDIPLLASTYQADTPDASVTPDVQVSRRFDAAAAGTDLELAAVRAVLERDRAAGPAAGQRR